MNAPTAVIEQFDRDQRSIIDFLAESKQISFASTSRIVFAKTLVLAIASAFEVELSDIVRLYVAKACGNNLRLCSLAEQKAINRQYHTWFNWKDLDVTQFFAMFGEQCKVDWKKAKQDAAIADGASAFMQLGSLRNTLIHGNFAAMTIDDTPDSVLGKYERAKVFVNYVKEYFAST